MSSGIIYIGKHCRRPTKNFIFKGNPLINQRHFISLNPVLNDLINNHLFRIYGGDYDSIKEDIGQYIRIRNTGPIKVERNVGAADPFTSFRGCRDVEIDCNFRAQLRVSAKAISEAEGQWSATISPSFLERGTTQVEICVAGTNVQTGVLMGGQTNVPVAEVTIQVMAR